VATVVQCLVLQQLVDQHVKAVEGPGESVDREAGMPAAELRKEIPRRLQEIGMRDLGQIPLEYHAVITRETAIRAIKRSDLQTLSVCLSRLETRASTRLLCYGAMHWRDSPEHFVRLLVRHGARIDGHRSARPLHCAIMASNHDMLAELLKQGADVHKQGRHLDTPLHVAVRKCDEKAFGILLEVGAQDRLLDRRHQSARKLAASIWNLHSKRCMRGPGCPRCSARRNILFRLCRPTGQLRPAQPVMTDGALSDESIDSDAEDLSDFGTEASFYSDLEYDSEALEAEELFGPEDEGPPLSPSVAVQRPSASDAAAARRPGGPLDPFLPNARLQEQLAALARMNRGSRRGSNPARDDAEDLFNPGPWNGIGDEELDSEDDDDDDDDEGDSGLYD